jgi:predicted lipoprotein
MSIMMKAMVLAVALLLAATPAGAMTGLEFLAFDKSASDQAAVMEPLVRQFVREGYHNVPDWSELAYMARALILEKGYRDKDIADIAKEAAIAHGMSK